MRITTKGRYGIRAVVALAASTEGKPVAISKIAREQEISPEFLEQIFFRLKKSGLIKSSRGPHGGFSLSREASQISVRQVLDAVEEHVAPAPCADAGTDFVCEREADCPTHPMWAELSGLIRGYLDHVTIKDLTAGGANFFPELTSSLGRPGAVPASA
jgi:Rrf2 family iron-sulfur cluster assembly transcriptional regulator